MLKRLAVSKLVTQSLLWPISKEQVFLWEKEFLFFRFFYTKSILEKGWKLKEMRALIIIRFLIHF